MENRLKPLVLQGILITKTKPVVDKIKGYPQYPQWVSRNTHFSTSKFCGYCEFVGTFKLLSRYFCGQIKSVLKALKLWL